MLFRFITWKFADPRHVVYLIWQRSGNTACTFHIKSHFCVPLTVVKRSACFYTSEFLTTELILSFKQKLFVSVVVWHIPTPPLHSLCRSVTYQCTSHHPCRKICLREEPDTDGCSVQGNMWLKPEPELFFYVGWTKVGGDLDMRQSHKAVSCLLKRHRNLGEIV